ncbi:Conserved hypothetical protein [Clostridium neonatale]|nr:Conserved hypothetical protein [Clostridium neonatale]CAI3224227.1 Conserved hypothetical protein [Clostridium neonatale]CAI3245965.1 Conserved hypothetical protein [Clostridium neonatale]CAI3576494.1 Conserved hypothetical protein [Clostridium neonatale]CAI3640687.1 Conserved hypothetical protein [Clostridium neonatale]
MKSYNKNINHSKSIGIVEYIIAMIRKSIIRKIFREEFSKTAEKNSKWNLLECIFEH